MAKNSRYNVQFRRKRSGRTNYTKRLHLLLARKPRLVIRKTLTGMIAQVVEYQPDGDKVLITVNSKQLTKFGLPIVNGNIPVAYLTGLLAAKQAKAHKITEVVVDLGLHQLTDKSRTFALIQGAREGGLKINADEKVFPAADRINGKHIEQYAATLKGDADAYKKQFGAYLKSNVDPSTISQLYAKVKAAIVK
ncbi:MAG TPA: 50S ribosomal protein L18 [Acidobacteriota bacterium]|nr:50S ribosomal protein L18 [Acidobacteriota bacterium]